MAVENLWHDNDECEIGLSLPLHARRYDVNPALKHCQYCALLNQPYEGQKWQRTCDGSRLTELG